MSQPPSQPPSQPHEAGARPEGADVRPKGANTQPEGADAQHLDELVERLERAAEQLRSGELSADAAATLVEDCAALATQASNELERLARAEVSPAMPGQESLL